MLYLYLDCRIRFIMFENIISPKWRLSALLLKKFSKVLNSSITNMVFSSSIIQSISSGMVLEKLFLAIFPLKEVTYGDGAGHPTSLLKEVTCPGNILLSTF